MTILSLCVQIVTLGILIPIIVYVLYSVVLHYYYCWKWSSLPGTSYVLPYPLFVFSHKDAWPINRQGAFLNREQYGDTWKVIYGTSPHIFFTKVEDIKKVMVTNAKAFDKDPRLDNLFNHLWGSTNVFAGDQAVWKKFHGVLSTGFTHNVLDQVFSAHVLPCTQRLKSVLSRKTPELVNTRQLFHALSFDIITSSGFGLELNVIEKDDSKETFEAAGSIFRLFLVYYLAPPWVHKYIDMLPVPSLQRLLQMSAKWKTFLVDTITNRRRSVKKNNHVLQSDVLSAMLNATENEGILTESELVSNCGVTLVAGQETTSTTCQRALYHISTHPDIQKLVANEVDSFSPKKNTWDEYTSHFKYVRALMYETLRICGPAPYYIRIANRDVEISGIKIPKSTAVVLNSNIWDADPTYWGSNYQDFKPERFLDKDMRKMEHFLPFGAGPRTCIGRILAEMEFIAAISIIFKNFTVECDPKDSERFGEISIEGTSKPRHDIMLKFVPRK